MAALDAVLQRLGFVKLAHYGLVLTPEGRIMSLRPAVLDGGFGARIVGWRDGDLAEMELPRCQPARPAAHAAVASRVATPPAPIAAKVAAEAEVEEDEWAWEIAIARARVATVEAAPARPPVVATHRRSDTVPPPVIPPVVAIDYEDYTSPAREVARTVRPPGTVIPVPKLPSIRTAARGTGMQPVVRAMPATATRGARPLPNLVLPPVPRPPTLPRIKRLAP